MKVETKNNLIVLVLVFGLIAIGAALFYWKGSKIAMMFGVIGIPLLFIIYSSYYIKKQKATRKDPSLILKQQEIEKIVYDYKDLTNKMKKASGEYGIDTSNNVESSLEDIVNGNFADIGIIVEDIEGTKSIKYNDDLINRNDVENLDSVLKNLHFISDQFNDLVQKYTESFSNRLISYLNDLKNSGYNIDQNISEIQNSINSHEQSNDFMENISYMDEMISLFDSALDSCIQQVDKVKQIVEELNKDVSYVDTEIEKVQSTKENYNFLESIATLISVMNKLESSASGDFNDTKFESLSSISTILNLIGSFEDENTEKLIEIQTKISAIAVSSKMDELIQQSKQIIPTSNMIVKSLTEKIMKNEGKIAEANPPSDFYVSESGSFQIGFDKILIETSISPYIEQLTELMQKVMPIYDKSQERAKVILAYGKIERKIQKQLDKNGFVSLKDIRIKNGEQFLTLFAMKHPDITYDSFNHTLEFIGGRPIYSLKINVLDANNKSAVNGLNLRLKKGSNVISQLESNSAGEVIFEDVMNGDYSIVIDKTSDYGELTKKITVIEDTTTEFLITKPSMGEKICKDKEENMQNTVKRFTNDLQREMNENKFITSNFNLKIKSDFIPCLLYVWSKENTAIKFIELPDGKYMVYDIKVAKKELENIIGGLEAGDREDIDDLREGFFSAPLPYDEIFDLIEKLKGESDFYNNVKYDTKFIWI